MPAAVTQRLDGLGIIGLPVLRQHRAPVDHRIGHTAPEDKRLFTDGNPLPGVEMRLADDGEICQRGPDLCLGYTDEALTAKAFDDDGWYHTGDIGVFDDDGYLTITDRKSDIIIRGGENISAVEVEEVLLAMPGVAEAVVVAAPTRASASAPRPCCGSGRVTTCRRLDEVRAHFEAGGVARQKWPEELHQVDDFPRTASGKVQKFRSASAVAERIPAAIALETS